MDNDSVQDWFIGQRVIDEDGYRATVRYIGPVASAKDTEAIWIGVEWDHSGRGRHDGSVAKADGTIVRHFTCERPGSNNASFLRPNKLDRGVNFTEVLHQRYVAMNAPLEAPNQQFEGAYANTSRGGQKAIEFHGEEKIRRHQQLELIEKVSMRGERVAYAGPNVRQEARHLVEVDLQGNLLSAWEEIGKLASQMPGLQVLHLNGNLLMPLPSSTPLCLLHAFPHLRTLILNSCNIKSWATAQRLETCLSALTELSLAGNQLGDIQDVCQRQPVIGFPQLQVLDLSATGLSSWHQVNLLAQLPALRLLSVNDNQIPDIAPPATSTEFLQLEALHISCNHISGWPAVDALDCFSALKGLRLTGNPVTKGMGQSQARQLLIARVGKVGRVNGAEVTRRERMDAEKSYIRMVCRELERVKGQAGRAEVLSRHPRYEALVQVHGDSTGSGLGGEGTGNLAKEMVKLRLMNMASGSMTMAPVEKRLPLTLTLAQLKLLCARLFGLETPLQVLYYTTDESAPPMLMDADGESLGYYGLTEGCQVFMNERDERAEARDLEALRDLERRRREEQEEQIRRLDGLKRAEMERSKRGVALAAIHDVNVSVI